MYERPGNKGDKKVVECKMNGQSKTLLFLVIFVSIPVTPIIIISCCRIRIRSNRQPIGPTQQMVNEAVNQSFNQQSHQQRNETSNQSSDQPAGRTRDVQVDQPVDEETVEPTLSVYERPERLLTVHDEEVKSSLKLLK